MQWTGAGRGRRSVRLIATASAVGAVREPPLQRWPDAESIFAAQASGAQERPKVTFPRRSLGTIEQSKKNGVRRRRLGSNQTEAGLEVVTHAKGDTIVLVVATSEG